MIGCTALAKGSVVLRGASSSTSSQPSALIALSGVQLLLHL